MRTRSVVLPAEESPGLDASCDVERDLLDGGSDFRNDIR